MVGTGTVTATVTVTVTVIMVVATLVWIYAPLGSLMNSNQGSYDTSSVREKVWS